MERLSQLIPRVLSKRGLKSQAIASYAVFLATEWLHEHLGDTSKKLSVKSLKDTVLSIESDHPVASQELSQIRESLKSHLNSYEGILVSDISIIRAT